MVRNDAIGKKEMLDILHSMTTDAARASDIVERVRQYAKHKAEPFVRLLIRLTKW